MASEELESSLRAEVEGFVNSRMGGILEELSRLQSQTNEMFTRFMERLDGEMQQDAPIYAAISEHLRAAHKRGIEEAAAESRQTKVSSDMALVKAAIEDLAEQQSQTNILNSLVNRAAAFAPRVAFFVIKNRHAIGWRARGLEGSVGDEAVRDMTLPLTAKTLLSDTVELRATWSGEPGANAEDHLLLEKLGGEPPRRMVAVPLIARQKVAAVLYADSAGLGPESINLEALETLVRVGGMSVELLAARRAPGAAPQTERSAAPQPVEQRATPAPPAAAPPAPAPPPPVEVKAAPPPPPPPPAPVPAPEPVFVEPEPPRVTAAPPPPPVKVAPPAPEVAAAPPPPPPPPPVVVPEPPPVPREDFHAPAAEAAPPPPALAPETVPAAVAAPLGSARQYGRMEVDLPIDVSESEKRLHIDARRFARLLVSEIKLYNEEKVQKGRHEGDLYERLREEIDRSRQMYEKRVAPQVASRYDYFHQELINTLAEGKADKLGRSYPGASA